MLTDQKKLFALHYAANGGNATQAAIEAGYSERTAAQSAWRVLQDDDVLEAIRTACVKNTAKFGPKALHVLAELAETAESETVRRQAAANLMEAAGLQVILHGGANNVFGQHFTCGTTNSPWIECFVGSAPGIPLREVFPEWQSVPEDGFLVPSDAPGFGIEVEESDISPFDYSVS